MTTDSLIACIRDDHGEIRVFDDGERRLLSFGPGDEQSACLKRDPAFLLFDYTQAMLLALLFQTPRKVLCLGLGAGSLIKALHRHVKGVKITGVEYRQAVIETAQQYFYLPNSRRIDLHCADAADYLRQNSGAYDLIFCDLYSLDGVSPLQGDRLFLQSCSEHLKPGGWLVLNGWRTHQHDADLLSPVQETFSEVRSLNTPEGNWILFAGQTPLATGNKLYQEARDWSARLGYDLVPYLKHSKVLQSCQ